MNQNKSNVPSEVIGQLVPTGRLRSALNLGNAALVQRDAASGKLTGVSVELAKELARTLGVPLDFAVYKGAGDVFGDVDNGKWDIAFLAIDAKRAEKISYTAPYVIIEGTYAVPAKSAIQHVDDIDQPAIRLAVAKNSAYDLYLTPRLKKAQIVRAPNPQASLEMFVTDKLEAVAGVRQTLEQFVGNNMDLRILPGAFTSINQAVAVAKSKKPALEFLSNFIEAKKRSGFVRQALDENGKHNLPVAPLAATLG